MVYGDPNCLRRFAGWMVRRIDELQSLVDEWTTWPDDDQEKQDPDIMALVNEHAELLELLVQIDKQVGLDTTSRPVCWSK